METTIVIIEPNKEYQKILREFLSSNGYDVTLCLESGDDIVNRLLKHHIAPDICIVDVNLYNSVGISTAREIKRYLPVKVVLYSNNLSKTPYSKFNEDSEIAHYFVDKGANPKILLRTLEFCAREWILCRQCGAKA